MRNRALVSLSFLLVWACGPAPECQSAAECDDNNACTVDSCSASACVNEAVSVDDQIDCTDDACDPTNGNISHTPNNALCNDSVGCTNDICQAATGCQNTPDNNLCNQDQTCDPLNDCQNNQNSPTLTAITPDDGLASADTPNVVITGTNLLANATVTVAGINVPTANCNYAQVPTQITCTIPASNNVTRGDVVVTNPDTQSATISNGWTFTGALNETDQAGEADFCDLQFPFATTTTVGAESIQIFGQIFEAGLTDTTVGAAAPGILAELGFGPLGANPITDPNWLFSSTQFNGELGLNNNNDEYFGVLKIQTTGTFSYTYRFSLDGGLNFTYCDQGPDAGGDGGSGSNGGLTFEANNLGTITIIP